MPHLETCTLILFSAAPLVADGLFFRIEHPTLYLPIERMVRYPLQPNVVFPSFSLNQTKQVFWQSTSKCLLFCEHK